MWCVHTLDPRYVKDPYFVPCLRNSGLWVPTGKQKSWLSSVQAYVGIKAMKLLKSYIRVKMVAYAHASKCVKDPYFVPHLWNSGLHGKCLQKSISLRAQCKCMIVGIMLMERLKLYKNSCVHEHTLPDVWKTHIVSPAYKIQDCESLHKNKRPSKVWDLSASVYGIYSGQLYV